MLCLGFAFVLFALHALKIKQNPSGYRRLTSHQKINICFSTLHTFALLLLIFYSPHHILKHLAIIQPKKNNALLWIIPESTGFNLILACQMVSPTLALLVSISYPLSFLESFIVLNGVFQMNL